ncbi:phosphodiester glycosidase family protein [Agilicoccus flavus]|uniref:phosphodiester glycosidase family protein n=1 Tax=Agilicoccus flavus TaxID=2775968 RepID=UPI001CF6AF27|nr:phosphodiester glycosidase family protein [Agilicoccus flavus]
MTTARPSVSARPQTGRARRARSGVAFVAAAGAAALVASTGYGAHAAAATPVTTASPVAAASPEASSPATPRTPGTPAARRSGTKPLPLGTDTLPETRRARTLAPGVTQTTIVRGVPRARASQIATTAYGPWRVNVVTVNPKTAKGRLQTTFGGDIARTEPVSTVAGWAKALFATNGGFFALGRSRLYPGDPVGLAIHAGMVVSEPTGAGAEQNVLIDSDTMRLRMGRFAWEATVRHRESGREARIDAVNTALATPAGCEGLPDPTECAAPGRLVRITPSFTRRTPAGPGVEVVLDRAGCIVRKAVVRGTRITGSQTTLQATGTDAAELAELATSGCLKIDETVRDGDGDELNIGPSTYGLTGRYRLVDDGEIVAPTGRNSISGRNPRTFLGRTNDGRVSVVTIDGRSVTSVGTSLTETARVAKALGFADAVNLDGGGSTTLVVEGRVANVPSTNGRQRPISDALVFVPRR